MTTPEIKGFFSKEHSLIVAMIVGCFYGLYQNNQTNSILLQNQAEMKADIKIITYRLDHENGIKTTEKQLAKVDTIGCKRKSLIQETSPFIIASINPISCFFSFTD